MTAARILLVDDEPAIQRALGPLLRSRGYLVEVAGTGTDALRLADDATPDLVVLDLQIGNMGGMAACMSIRLDESVDRLEHVTVLMLLDRDVDAFLANRAEADGWIVKPLDSFRLRKAATALLAGEPYQEGMSTTVREATTG